MKQFTRISIVLFTLLIYIGAFSQQKPSNYYNEYGNKSMWNIDNYSNKVDQIISSLENSYKEDVINVESYKPMEEPTKIKKRTSWNKKKWQKNDQIAEQEKVYHSKVDLINKEYKDNIAKYLAIRSEWEKFANEERDRIAKEELERIKAEETARLFIIQQKKDESIAQVRAKEEYAEALAYDKAIPTNPKYLKWKSEYERSLSLSKKYKDRCVAIIKKNTFKNSWGRKMYDPSDFSQTDKKSFIANIKAWEVQHTKIGELEDDEFIHYWNNTSSPEKATRSYHLSTTFNELRWTF